jgi:hypothetical protein
MAANEVPRLPGKFLGIGLTVLLALALGASLVTGVPEQLPGVALGSPVVLHAERALAIFAASLLVLVVLVRAFQGMLPTELSGRGVKYAQREATEEIRDTTAAALEGLQTAQRELAARVDSLEDVLQQDDAGGPPDEGDPR